MRYLNPQRALMIKQLAPMFARISEIGGAKFLGVFDSTNIRLLPRHYLITATVVEEGSIFDRCLRESPPQMVVMCFKLAVDKARAMGYRILALRMPTKWERFKLWGWKRLPRPDEVSADERIPRKTGA